MNENNNNIDINDNKINSDNNNNNIINYENNKNEENKNNINIISNLNNNKENTNNNINSNNISLNKVTSMKEFFSLEICNQKPNNNDNNKPTLSKNIILNSEQQNKDINELNNIKQVKYLFN